MSDIGAAIRELGRRTSSPGTRSRGGKSPGRRRGDPTARLGLLDALLVLIAVAAVITRTPIGGLASYGAARVRGHQADLPSLTAYFSSGAVAPPLDLAVVPATGPVDADQLPEPWRTAARTTLAQELPAALVAVLEARGVAPTPESALGELDALWKVHRDAGLVLEVAALGQDQRDRAVARAVAAGEPDPESYDGHRRYLSGGAASEADRFVGGTLALATALDLGWPLTVDYRLTSPFGDRIHPTLGEKKFHEGVDLAVPIGTPVLAAQRGTLAVVGKSAVSGQYVVIDHGYGVRTAYCHLSSTPVVQGTVIARGETFALSGNTGRSTGPHLHYGIQIAGNWVDPERFKR
ncbi:MAG: M23 family metallopeptidase [Myxococcota bacterium]